MFYNGALYLIMIFLFAIRLQNSFKHKFVCKAKTPQSLAGCCFHNGADGRI